MSEKFLIHIHFTELIILNVEDYFESKEIKINLDLQNAEIESKIGKIITFQNGLQEIDSKFDLQSEEMVDDEDFMFTSFGKNLTVNLSTDKKESKKRKSEISKSEVITRGEIDLLQLWQNNERKSFIVLEIVDNTEMALSFEVYFENPPQVSSILSVQINSFHNLKVTKDSSIEACLRFPYDDNFRAAMIEKSLNPHEISSRYLLDDSLKEIKFENNSRIQLKYENFLTERGLKYFNQLIENKQSFLIEFRIDGKMMMAFIDLDIFNFPGICDMNFISPLYEWNKSLIQELFQQEASLKDEKFTEKRGKKISTKKNETNELIPIFLDDKDAAISVKIKFSDPQTPDESIEDLVLKLDEKFNFIDKRSTREEVLHECDENFKLIIQEIVDNFENFINDNPEMCEEEIKSKMESIYDKNILKDSVQALIGNVYNDEKKTETNHEFKLLMVEVHKALNRKMKKIVSEKWNQKPKKIMEDKLRRIQINEWMELKSFTKVEEIIKSQLKNEDDIKKLEELAFYQFKLENLKDCEETLMKILKIDQVNEIALYFLSYLTQDRDICSAILAMRLLVKISPISMEYLIILKSFYEEINFTAGEKFCSANLRESKFIPIFEDESVLYPKVTSIDPLINILHHQLSSKAMKYLKFTKSAILEQNFEVKLFGIIQNFEEGKFNEASSVLQSIEVNADNEIIMRILKGNLLYSTFSHWRAICEYEIAFNLCLKENLKFPHLLALRCGLWYLDRLKNTSKARRYFHYCCKNYGTFHSWNGLGIVNFLEMSYEKAEKYLNLANQIDTNCGTNWAYLSITNCKLNRMDIALKCYFIAKKCGVENNELLIEMEKELKI